MKEGVDVYTPLFHPVLAGISDKESCKREEQTGVLDYMLN